MANENIHEFARSKRGVYPSYIEKRVELLRTTTRNYIKAAGGPAINALGAAVGSEAPTTIPERIRKGTLTLKDMVWIQTKYNVDWSMIVASVAADISEYELSEEPFDKENPKEQAKRKKGLEMKTTQEDREAFLALMRNGSEGQTQWMI